MAPDEIDSSSLMPLLRQGYNIGMAATVLLVAAITGMLLALSMLVLIY